MGAPADDVIYTKTQFPVKTEQRQKWIHKALNLHYFHSNESKLRIPFFCPSEKNETFVI